MSAAIEISKLATIKDRENLIQASLPHYSGFTPRPVEQLTKRRKPHSGLDIELQHYLRSNTENLVHGRPTLEYRLWLEAGKHVAPFPQRPDASYNSNVWRNFRRHYGFELTADGKKTSDVIAAMYPLNIPAPSQVGGNTFAKYIAETRLFETDKYKFMAIKRTKADMEEFKRLKIKAEVRNPPLDEDGNILPPENFKKYVPRFLPPCDTHPDKALNQKTDFYSQRINRKNRPFLHKLSYALHHPDYDAIREEILKRKEEFERKEDYESKEGRITAPTPSSFQAL